MKISLNFENFVHIHRYPIFKPIRTSSTHVYKMKPNVILIALVSKVTLLVFCAVRVALSALEPRSTDSLGTKQQNLNVTLIE